MLTIRHFDSRVRALSSNHIEGWDGSPNEILADLGLAKPSLEANDGETIWSFESCPRANRLRRVRSYRWRG